MMRTCVDFHSHVLPGVDDGSRSVEESLAMLRMEAEQGVTRVVATPHFYARNDTPERFLKRRAEAWGKLQAALVDQPELPKIILGAEVYYFPGISDSEVLSQLTIGQNPFIMIEMPCIPWTKSMYQEIDGIYSKTGITPVIAHIDRYISPFRTHGIPKRLEQMHVLVQANGSFFLQPSTASMAMRMLKENRIQFLGSDCHNLDDRKPNLGNAIKKIEKRLGVSAFERIQHFEDIVLL
jgi:protein-tyrosine phosphatase